MEHEPRYISLLSDYGFKTVFADESDTFFLRKALQALLKSEVPIEEVRFLRNEFSGITKEARGGAFDLICEDEIGRTFIVEMQLAYYKEFIQRAKFYAFHKFNTLVERGKYKFENLTPIYCIGFLAKGIFPKSREYYHFGRLRNQKGEELDGQITHIIVEIDKFEKKEVEIQSDLDKLIYFMKHLEHIEGIDQLPKVLNEEWIEQAMTKLDKSKMTPDQRFHYEMMMAKNASIIQIEKDREEQMRKRVVEEVRQEVAEEVRQEVAEEVRQEVAEEVRQEVVEEVRQEVVEEVRQEVAEATRKTAKETAKKLKKLGVEINVIAQSTGLTQKEIENL